MSTKITILFPHVRFVCKDASNEDDFGITMAVVEELPGKHFLHVKSNISFVRCYDAAFTSPKSAMDWALQQYLHNGSTVWDKKEEPADLPPEPKMKRSELADLMAQFQAKGGSIQSIPQGRKTKVVVKA